MMNWILVIAAAVAAFASLGLFVTAFATAYAGNIVDGALVGVLAACTGALAYCANELTTGD